MLTVESSTYWDRFAQSYASLGGPLRPSRADVAAFESIVRQWTVSQRIIRPRALLLGATPAIATMQWPDGTWLTGLDRSFPMAKSVWPGDSPGERGMVCGDWLQPSLGNNSCDLVIGDGSLNCLTYPIASKALVRAVSGLLRRGGLLILRCYIQAEPRESPDDLQTEALRGAIASFHTFKLRLLMALQPTLEEGVAVRDAYRWIARNVDLPSLSKTAGWPRAEVETIEHYKDSDTIYAFPTLDQQRAALLPEFAEVSFLTTPHEMSSRCPILGFRPTR